MREENISSKANATTELGAGEDEIRPEFEGTSILHVSDIHVGIRFDAEKWEELKHLAASIGPDLIAVTGDIVNSPWRWTLNGARKRLDELIASAATTRPDVQLVFVPGNHDTRWQGILPLSWIAWLSMYAFVTFLLSFWGSGFPADFFSKLFSGQLDASGYVAAVMLPLALGLAALRLCMCGNLKVALGKYYLAGPAMFADKSIGVLPFDSASRGLSWARGYVLRGQMTQARKWVDLNLKGKNALPREPFLLALVHHHPLPLPYDHAHERMMVMDNAGEFLRQLAHSKVRLVLHGHKHHQHYARLAVDPATDQRLEVAVLSAGTPTEGVNTLANRHGFNHIVITPDNQVSITRYESAGGPTFHPQASFRMVDDEEHRRQRFASRCSSSLSTCKRVVCVADITRYGDGFFTREYRGLRTSRRALTELPSILRARSDSGVVEPYSIRPLSHNGPGVRFQNERISLNEVAGKIGFNGAGLSHDDAPIDFQLEFLNNNAFALNAWQFKQMYPEREDFTEDVQFGLNPDVAAEELVIHVHFPVGMELPSRVNACSFPGASPNKRRLLLGADIVRIDTQNALQLTLRHPQQDVVYQLAWDVSPQESSGTTEEGANEALALRQALAQLIGKAVPAELLSILENGLEEFKAVMQPEDGVKVEAAFMAYQEDEQALVSVCSTDYRNHCYRFGLGIAGRSFKASETLSFLLPADAADICGTGYLSPDGMLPEKLSDIPFQGIVCIPLYPEDAPEWPFAVLQFSWTTPSRALRRNVYQGRAAPLEEAFAIAFPPILKDILFISGLVRAKEEP